MSLLVKGMKMPNTCWRCPMYNHRVSYCNAQHRSLGYADEPDKNRTAWCPLVEVPTPHGDLVDIDKALNHLPENYNKEDLEDAVATAPTIIEAEGEEENVD